MKSHSFVLAAHAALNRARTVGPLVPNVWIQLRSDGWLKYHCSHVQENVIRLIISLNVHPYLFYTFLRYVQVSCHFTKSQKHINAVFFHLQLFVVVFVWILLQWKDKIWACCSLTFCRLFIAVRALSSGLCLFSPPCASLERPSIIWRPGCSQKW